MRQDKGGQQAGDLSTRRYLEGMKLGGRGGPKTRELQRLLEEWLRTGGH